MKVKAHRAKDLQQLRDISRKHLDAKQRDRYRAVLLALQGQTTKTIMHTLDRSKNFVQRWVYAYRDGGIMLFAQDGRVVDPGNLQGKKKCNFVSVCSPDRDPKTLSAA